MGSKTLMVIDMLNDFVDPKGVLYCGADNQTADIVANNLHLVKHAISEGWNLIFIMDSHAQNDKEFERFASHAVKDTWGAQLHPELQKAAEEYRAAGGKVWFVPKTRYGAFYKTELESIITQIGVSEAQAKHVAERGNEHEFIVSGVCTNICVLHTVEELCNRDLKVKVIVNAVTSFDREGHQWALRHMAEILGAELAALEFQDGKLSFTEVRT